MTATLTSTIGLSVLASLGSNAVVPHIVWPHAEKRQRRLSKKTNRRRGKKPRGGE